MKKQRVGFFLVLFALLAFTVLLEFCPVSAQQSVVVNFNASLGENDVAIGHVWETTTGTAPTHYVVHVPADSGGVLVDLENVTAGVNQSVTFNAAAVYDPGNLGTYQNAISGELIECSFLGPNAIFGFWTARTVSGGQALIGICSAMGASEYDFFFNGSSAAGTYNLRVTVLPFHIDSRQVGGFLRIAGSTLNANLPPVGGPVWVGGWDGTNVHGIRTDSVGDILNLASAANMSAFSGQLAAMLSPVGNWTAALTSVSPGAQGTVTRPAGGTNVRHVANCIGASAIATTAPAQQGVFLYLRDGGTGAGTVLASYLFIFPATTGNLIAPVQFCGLNIVGSLNTAMTLEFNLGVASVQEDVLLTGWDTQ